MVAVAGPVGTPGTAATSGGTASFYETSVSLGALDEAIDGGASDRFEAPAERLPVQVWIGRGNGRVLRVRVRQVERQGDATVRSAVDVTFLGFGEAQVPEAPAELPDA